MAKSTIRGGFFDLSDGLFTGKGLSSLIESRNQRDDLIAMFGGIEHLPSSIMRAERSRNYEERDEVVHGGRKYSDTFGKVSSNKELQGAFGVSGAGAAAGALSIFPRNIGRTVLLLYSNPGDVVVDPFAGHNSRMELCVTNGRHYIGCDLSAEFMKFNKKRAQELRDMLPKAKIELHHCDSRKMPVTPGIGDFTLTSPPYFDIEQYGNEPEQLGKCKSYNDFLDSLQQVVKENYRCLKPGAYAAWFVNDFRRKGTFHLYHADLCRLAENAGFIMHDIMVVDFGRGFRDIFINQTVKDKIIPKRHEYGVIFKKPERSESGRAKKVVEASGKRTAHKRNHANSNPFVLRRK